MGGLHMLLPPMGQREASDVIRNTFKIRQYLYNMFV